MPANNSRQRTILNRTIRAVRLPPDTEDNSPRILVSHRRVTRARDIVRSSQMKRFAILAAALFAICLAGSAQAEDVMAGKLKISAPWARATPKGAAVGGGYMTITNTGTTPDRLVGGSTDVAGKFEIHEMKMDNGVMKMRPVEGGLEIKPGQTVQLDPGGYHIMLMGMKQQLKEGEHFKATLDFEKAGKVDVDFTVAGIGATHGGSFGTMSPKMQMDMKPKQ
jgi:periplasmic copper chaperone A